MPDNSPVSKKIEEKKVINLLSLSVVRRDGSIAQFKSEKIFNAIKKAFLAQTKIRNNKDKDDEQTQSIHKTIDNLTNIVMNTKQAKGRKLDADMAAESIELSKSRILQQAATSMLAQANKSMQSVLELLQ